MSRAELSRRLDQDQFERLCWDNPMTLITPEGRTIEVYTSLEILPGVTYRTKNGCSLQKKKDRIILNGETISRGKQFSHIRRSTQRAGGRVRRCGAESDESDGGHRVRRRFSGYSDRPPQGDGSDAETLMGLALGSSGANRMAGSIVRKLGAGRGPSGWSDPDVFGNLEPGLLLDYSDRRDDIAEAEMRLRTGPRRQNSFGSGLRPPRAPRGRDTAGVSASAPPCHGGGDRWAGRGAENAAPGRSVVSTGHAPSGRRAVPGSSLGSGAGRVPAPTASRRAPPRDDDAVEVGCEGFVTDNDDSDASGSSACVFWGQEGSHGATPDRRRTQAHVSALSLLRRLSDAAATRASGLRECDRVLLRRAEQLLVRLSADDSLVVMSPGDGGGGRGGGGSGGHGSGAGAADLSHRSACIDALEQAADALRGAGMDVVARDTERVCRMLRDAATPPARSAASTGPLPPPPFGAEAGTGSPPALVRAGAGSSALPGAGIGAGILSSALGGLPAGGIGNGAGAGGIGTGTGTGSGTGTGTGTGSVGSGRRQRLEGEGRQGQGR
eukprot:TRINITY_DN9215_c0_g1_i7.p1 TRINITY_DN9215_c0_g1~~TRINITY_DN9215_c0_g1_i7.p1  ORF type:complete len:553 (+),score=109.16 TRINITY_DN9215_c0_g1_i7:82-1740(+)